VHVENRLALLRGGRDQERGSHYNGGKGSHRRAVYARGQGEAPPQFTTWPTRE
jgi:hypothetical protein